MRFTGNERYFNGGGAYAFKRHYLGCPSSTLRNANGSVRSPGLLLASNNIRDTERAETSERGRKRGGWNGGKEGRGAESVVVIRGEKKREGETVGEVFSNRTRGIFNMAVSGRVDDIIIGCQDYLLVFLIRCFVLIVVMDYIVMQLCFL